MPKSAVVPTARRYNAAVNTPIRQQYVDVKARHPDAIVLFRLGDFYEAFDDDAKLCARELDLTLTSKPMGKGLRVPLAGLPHQALDGYLARLVARGYRVAVCEQLADPRTVVKGIVARDVVRVVTPGTLLEGSVVEGRANTYLAALTEGDGVAGLAWADISTGEFVTSQLDAAEVATELARLQPAELLLERAGAADGPEGFRGLVTAVDVAGERVAEEALREHFGAVTLEPYGCAGLPGAIRAAAALLAYVRRTAPPALAQMSRLTTRSGPRGLVLDPATRRNLALFPAPGGTSGDSLLETIDLTRTAAGARMLRRWLGEPLADVGGIAMRQAHTGFFLEDAALREEVGRLLRSLPDLERLIGRIAAGYAGPREMVALRRGLELAPQVIAALQSGVARFPAVRALPEVTEAIATALVDDPPVGFEEGGVVREGCSPELDGLRRIAKDARGGLAELERAERERTGIRKLRVGYQRVFGYYIEVSNANREHVPDDYERRQTLVNAQRYVTPALRQYEAQALEARDRISELESDLFRRLCAQVTAEVEAIRAVAAALAELDVYLAFAEAAVRYGYVRPEVDEGEAIRIREGRHSVVERKLAAGVFVPNDTLLDTRESQIIVLTGPNMAGKSTYLRQVALIAIMAHLGCYVPASEARIGLLDRVFTRVGAQDDLAAGRSTFMVEMVETAVILNQATRRSLVVLDEVGRGTSTYDGLAIARAVIEYLHNRPELETKTLFATHYHELIALADTLPRVRNENVAVSEEGGRVTFLYRIVAGGADRSYGIHVGRLAGLPRAVIARSEEILRALESQRGGQAAGRREGPPSPQLPLLPRMDPIWEELAELDLDAMTPLEAMTQLYELRERARAREDRGPD